MTVESLDQHKSSKGEKKSQVQIEGRERGMVVKKQMFAELCHSSSTS
jgi:hypothetical protein